MTSLLQLLFVRCGFLLLQFQKHRPAGKLSLIFTLGHGLTLSFFVLQLSPKPSLTADGQVSSPTLVNSSAQPSSKLTAGDALLPTHEDIKMEVKKQEGEEEEDDQEAGSQKKGKVQPEVKTEEKPEASSPALIY